jgi:hypothetical protein
LQLHHVAIQVSDLARAEAFYSGLLGLREVRRQPHSIWLDAGGIILMLEVAQGAPSPAPWKSDRPGLHLVAFAIPAGERRALKARLAEAGVALEAESAYTIYFRDPEGNRLGLSHYPEAAG